MIIRGKMFPYILKESAEVLLLVNGCFLGDHMSGYNSFSFNLIDLAKYGEEGENVILVRVTRQQKRRMVV
jgi:hypothetical protein